MENNNQEPKDGKIKQTAKQAANKGKNQIKKTILKKVILPYVVPFLGIVLVVALGLVVLGNIIQSIIDLFSGSDIFSYTDENGNTIESIYVVQHADGTYEFEIDDNYKEFIKNHLKESTGFDAERVYLEDDLLEKMIKAEATTSLPKIGKEGFQGDVIVSRYDATEETEESELTEEEKEKKEEEAQMIYLSPDDFKAKYDEALGLASGIESRVGDDRGDAGSYGMAATTSSDIEDKHLGIIEENTKETEQDIESQLKTYDCYYTLGKLSTDDAGEISIEQEVIPPEVEGGDTIIKSDLSQILMIKYDKTVTIDGIAENGQVTVTNNDGGSTTHTYDYSNCSKTITYNVSIESISYRNMISQYNMAFSFLFSLLEVSYSPNWVEEVVDLVINDSIIDFVIHDNYSETTNRTISQYTNIINTENSSGEIDVIDTEETINCTHSLSTDIVKVRTWLYNKDIYFKRTEENPSASITTTTESDTDSVKNKENEEYSKAHSYEYKQVAEQNASDEDASENEETKQLIYIGDYRTIELKNTIGENGIAYIAGINWGYDQFINGAEEILKNDLNADPKKNVVFALGFQDVENCDQYISEYQKLIQEYPDTNFYFLTVNPVIDEQSPNRKNSEIQEFNTKLKNAFPEETIDTYNLITDDMIIYNGFLYSTNGYSAIHNAVISKVGAVGSIPSSADGKEWIDVRPFLRLWKNATGEVEYSSELDEEGKPINYDFLKRKSVDGKFVLYETKNIGKVCPDQAIISGSPLLFMKLGENEKTQKYETILRYLLNQYTGSDKYGDIDVQEILDFFQSSSFNSVSGLYGNTVEEQIWNFLILKGATKEGAAAALGNLYNESGFQTDAENSSSGAYGIVQWTDGRKGNLYTYANNKGTTPDDLLTQLEFMWQELETISAYKSVYDAITTSTDINYITAVWGYKYEVYIIGDPNNPKDSEMLDDRIPAAQNYYNEYKDLEITTGGTIQALSGDGYSQIYTSSTGRTYIEYKQFLGSWAGKSFTYYGESMSSSGCSVTSVAVVTSGYNNNQTPGTLRTETPNLANLLTRGGAQCSGYEKGDAARLTSGKPAVVSIRGTLITERGSKYYSGHYIAILDGRNGNEVYVSDVGANSLKCGGWTNVQNILNIINKGVLYVNN